MPVLLSRFCVFFGKMPLQVRPPVHLNEENTEKTAFYGVREEFFLMPLGILSGTTGIANLPDIGTLSYNGVTFCTLYKSKVSGVPKQDEAGRTTKYVDWLIDVDANVTLQPGISSTDQPMHVLRQRLTQPAGALVYTGQGFGGLVVNVPGGKVKDIAWGPITDLVDFQPLGGGNAAFVKWNVRTRIPELKPIQFAQGVGGIIGGFGLGLVGAVLAVKPVLQFNYETKVEYDDAGYSRLSLSGTLEIGMTRKTQTDRSLPDIVSDYRQAWLNFQFDLPQFRVVDRSFTFSRDKRMCEFSFSLEELPPIGLPFGATVANGTFSVKSATKGLAIWNCSLNCTYTIPKYHPQRLAAEAFYSMLWFKMHCSEFGIVPLLNNAGNAAQQALPNAEADAKRVIDLGFFRNDRIANSVDVMNSLTQKAPHIFKKNLVGIAAKDATKKALITEFGFEEGLYLDSKRQSFHASWMLMTNWQSILASTGIWKPSPTENEWLWANDMQSMMGWRSWMENLLDRDADVIVDIGGGFPPNSSPFSDPFHPQLGGN